MTRIVKYSETIWPAVEAAIPNLQAARQNSSDPGARAGVNFSIIVSSACFMEGILETSLRALLGYHRDTYNKIDIQQFNTRYAMNVYFERIEARITTDIGRTIGARGYDEMFELLLGRALHTLSEVAPRWEAVTTLFTFRNVLGHGREVTGLRTRGPDTRGEWEEDFAGGYAKVEQYLRKAGVLAETFFEKHSEYIYLSDAIADHFWGVASSVTPAVLSSLDEEEKQAIETAIGTRRTGAS